MVDNPQKKEYQNQKKSLKIEYCFIKGCCFFVVGLLPSVYQLAKKSQPKNEKSAEIKKYEKSFLFIKQFV